MTRRPSSSRKDPCSRRATSAAFPVLERTRSKDRDNAAGIESSAFESLIALGAVVERIGDAADLFANALGFAGGLPGVTPDARSAYSLRLRWRIVGVEVMPWSTMEARTTKPTIANRNSASA